MSIRWQKIHPSILVINLQNVFKMCVCLIYALLSLTLNLKMYIVFAQITSGFSIFIFPKYLITRTRTICKKMKMFINIRIYEKVGLLIILMVIIVCFVVLQQFLCLKLFLVLSEIILLRHV